MATSPQFWNKIAKRYAKRKVSDQAAYEKKLALTQARLTPEMQVLEVGCGTGTTALKHAPHLAFITGVDFSEEMIRIAKDRASEQGVENAAFQVADLHDFTGAEGGYDMVMAHSVIHLVEDEGAFLAKVRTLLKPGGLFVSSTMCLGESVGLWRVLIPLMQMIGLAPSVRFFTETDLRTALDDAGYEIEEAWQPGPKKALFLIARKRGE